MNANEATRSARGWASLLSRPAILLTIGLLCCMSALGQDNSVPIMSTDQLEAQMKSQTAQLQATISDLDDVTKAKTAIFEEVAGEYNADPSRRNWGKVYLVHFSLAKDEAVLLSKVTGLATKVNFGIAEDRQRKVVFLSQKEHELTEMMARLDQVRENYQAAAQRLAQAASQPAREDLERQKASLVRLLEAEWGGKVEIETTIARTKEGVARADDDAKAVSLLTDEVRSRRDVCIARLKQAREKFERGQVLGPDPALEGAKEGLGSLLTVVSGLSKSLEDRNRLPDAQGSKATTQPAFRTQIMKFLESEPGNSTLNPIN